MLWSKTKTEALCHDKMKGGNQGQLYFVARRSCWNFVWGVQEFGRSKGLDLRNNSLYWSCPELPHSGKSGWSTWTWILKGMLGWIQISIVHTVLYQYLLDLWVCGEAFLKSRLAWTLERFIPDLMAPLYSSCHRKAPRTGRQEPLKRLCHPSSWINSVNSLHLSGLPFPNLGWCWTRLSPQHWWFLVSW